MSSLKNIQHINGFMQGRKKMREELNFGGKANDQNFSRKHVKESHLTNLDSNLTGPIVRDII